MKKQRSKENLNYARNVNFELFRKDLAFNYLFDISIQELVKKKK